MCRVRLFSNEESSTEVTEVLLETTETITSFPVSTTASDIEDFIDILWEVKNVMKKK